MIRSALLFLTFLVFATAVTSLSPRLADHVDWSPCEGYTDIEDLSCGYYTVPLDWTNLGDPRNATLYVARHTVDPAKRVATVFINPGGPGASGVDLVYNDYHKFENMTGGIYDIVSWDPRGVGEKTSPGQVSCFESAQEEFAFWAGTPIGEPPEVKGNFTQQSDIDNFYAEKDALEARFSALRDKCLSSSSGEHMEYVGTAATVRDLASVALSDVLDGENSPVNFMGYSYGTVIALWLTSMFPERSGRVVLDGVVNPESYTIGPSYLGWATSMESTDETFQAFAIGCELAGPRGCVLANDSVTGGTDILTWTQRLADLAYDEHQHNETLPGSSFVKNMIIGDLYNVHSWPSLAQDLYDLWVAYTSLTSGAEAALLNSNLPRNLDPPDYLRWNNYAIECGDSIDRGNTTTDEVFGEIMRVSREVSGFFSSTLGTAETFCYLWPFRSVERFRGPFNPTLRLPALVIGNAADPITPLKSARAVADLLGASGVLVEQNGFGHSSMSQKSKCMNAIILNYFLNGTYPQGDDTICEVDHDIPIFPLKGVTASDISQHLAVGARSRRHRPVAVVRQPMNLSPTETRVYFILCIILLVLLGLQILFLLARWMYPKIQQYRDGKRTRYAPVRELEQSAEKTPFRDVEASGLQH